MRNITKRGTYYEKYKADGRTPAYTRSKLLAEARAIERGQKTIIIHLAFAGFKGYPGKLYSLYTIYVFTSYLHWLRLRPKTRYY